MRASSFFAASGKTLWIALLACGCRKSAPVAQQEQAASATANVSAPAEGTISSARTPPPAASTAMADRPLTEKEKKLLAAYKAALGRGRLLTKKKDYDAAVAAFTEAITADPGDARAHAERGFARLLQGYADDAKQDLEGALLLTGDPDLLSPIWFNLGLLREKAKDDEGARTAFANAHLLKPSSATKTRLQGKSTCSVEIRRTGLDDLKSVAGFRGLHGVVGAAETASAEQPTSEAHAKGLVCAPDHYEYQECADDAPFALMRNYMFYNYQLHWVFPHGKGLFWVYGPDGAGGWPARCQGATTIDANVDGELIRVLTKRDGKDAAFDGEENDEGRCKDGVSSTQELFFDARSGKAIAAIAWLGSSGASITVESRSVVIRGGGCDERVSLGPKP
jgi:tetratricopeptide (TPR) repeat protein